MNRINDSLQLFTKICSNELLKRVHLVLFLSAYSNFTASIHLELFVQYLTDLFLNSRLLFPLAFKTMQLQHRVNRQDRHLEGEA